MQRDRAAREEERRRLRELDRERRLQKEEADRVARERERLRYQAELSQSMLVITYNFIVNTHTSQFIGHSSR